MKNQSNKEYIAMTISAIWPWLFVVLIAIIAIIKGIFAEKIDPLDNSVNKNREIVEQLDVVDSTSNGFRVVYATKSAVTSKRLEEIRNRPLLLSSFKRLKLEAPAHFNNNLLDADIYDFAVFAKKYNTDPDVVLHNIFVTGVKKCKLYVRPNPKIKNCATWFDFNTEQGAQYLSSDDLYMLDYISTKKVYRYWKCSVLHSTSATDERFSHFSEDERIR